MFPRGAGPLLRRRAALCIRPSAPAEYHIQRLEAGECVDGPPGSKISTKAHTEILHYVYHIFENSSIFFVFVSLTLTVTTYSFCISAFGVDRFRIVQAEHRFLRRSYYFLR